MGRGHVSDAQKHPLAASAHLGRVEALSLAPYVRLVFWFATAAFFHCS